MRIVSESIEMFIRLISRLHMLRLVGDWLVGNWSAKEGKLCGIVGWLTGVGRKYCKY